MQLYLIVEMIVFNSVFLEKYTVHSPEFQLEGAQSGQPDINGHLSYVPAIFSFFEIENSSLTISTYN